MTMATFETKCGSCQPFDSVFKILLTVFPTAPQQRSLCIVPEYVLLNLLKSRIDFEEGDEVEVTLRVTKKRKETLWEQSS
jgi:hypothetical protein